MNIPGAQVAFKKKIGKSQGRDLWHYKLKGGLHLIVDHLGRPIGSGPHAAVARHTAQMTDPDLVWTELSKSDYVPVEAYEAILPEYVELTQRLQKMESHRHPKPDMGPGRQREQKCVACKRAVTTVASLKSSPTQRVCHNCATHPQNKALVALDKE